MVSHPVGTRSMIAGAAIAPRIPETPATVETSPIWIGGKPASMRRSMATKKRALTARFVSGAQMSSTRKNGLDHV